MGAARPTKRERRYLVAEVEGWPIRAEGVRRASWSPMLSVSVLDSAYCYREVARWNQENERPGTVTEKRERMRNRAAGFAAMLEGQR